MGARRPVSALVAVLVALVLSARGAGGGGAGRDHRCARPRVRRRRAHARPAPRGDAPAAQDGVRGDLVAGRLDTGRIAAVGHSAGAYTAAAMFTAGHSPRLRGAVVVAGARPRIDFGGPAAPMLIVHGGADPVVPYATGRATYDRMPWPKAFLTLTRLDHGSYLSPGRRGYAPTMATVTDIQRKRRYLDQRARHRIPADAQRPGVARLTGHL